jgi:hypothetical protein
MIDDDPDDHVAFDGRRIAKAHAACVMHLADLRQFELWPDEVATLIEISSRRSGGRKVRISSSSPGAMCADLAAPS